MTDSPTETEVKRQILLRISPAQHDRLVQEAAHLTIKEGRKVSVTELVRRRAVLGVEQVAA